MSNCLLCKVDRDVATDEKTFRALYFLIGKHALDSLELCEEHVRAMAACLPTLSIITGFGEYADAIRQALAVPKLRLVPSHTSSGGEAR